MNILTADCVIIWWCWILWGRNWRIIVLPSIYALCGTLLIMYWLVQQIMEIMVESALLYVIMLVVYIPFIIIDNPYSLYLQVVLVSVTGFMPTLILLHVTSGNQSGNMNPVSPDNNIHSAGLQSQSKLSAKSSVTCIDEKHAKLIIPAKSGEVV
ncbi:uncharacterized protein EV420DRAFT_1486648 [Desarmillaria tabescens]|uniref:Uncharacterized protein n=1 Tax=Armillaria tabescens TaxID=1929756 RepID=A0AA39JC02_ARMTA|nr:uncharacterized protein EV420DRAFT_1486648 [Desarmillaria tabescens]KAK0438534.1 hypothetical protein EV420DRAFT_1486648 [Desarmillaria tabescens]